MRASRSRNWFGNAGLPRFNPDAATAEAEPLSPALPFKAPEDPKAKRKALIEQAGLTELQMFAMMRMSNDKRHQAIWHAAQRLIFTEGTPFTGAAFYQLKDKGLAYKPEGKNFHLLTPAAYSLAREVADELVDRHRLHAMYVQHPREDSMNSRFFCTCGYSRLLTIGGNMQVKAESHFCDHLMSVNAVKGIEGALTLAPSKPGDTIA